MSPGHQQRDAIDHRSVDHLAAAGLARFQQRARQAECEQHPAPAEVAQQVQRWHRRPARRADRVQRAGHRAVVDVVTGLGGQRPVLPPARHPPVNQPRVACLDDVGPEPEPLGDARPESFHERFRGIT